MSKVISVRIDEEKSQIISSLQLCAKEVFYRGLEAILEDQASLAATQLKALKEQKAKLEKEYKARLEEFQERISKAEDLIDTRRKLVVSSQKDYFDWIQRRALHNRRMDYAQDPMSYVKDMARDHPYLPEKFFKDKGTDISAIEVLEILEGS